MCKSTILLVPLLLAVGSAPLAAQVAQTNSFGSLNAVIPPGDPSGLINVQTVSSPITNLASVQVSLCVSGNFNGDLYGYVRHVQGGVTNFCVLLNRAGRTASNGWGFADSGFNVLFADGAPAGDVHTYQASASPAAGAPLTGLWQPDGRSADPAVVLDTSPRTTFLGSFTNCNPNGTWTLFLASISCGSTNTLVSWGVLLAGVPPLTLDWAAPAAITYGTALGSNQLNAAASVPGLFAYDPPAGTILNAGTQTLAATFSPADASSYSPLTTNVTLVVAKASPAALVTSSANPQLPGQAVTFNALLGAAGSGVAPSGTVQFVADGQAAGPPVPLNAGLASFTTASLEHGEHAIVANYTGDGNYLGATNLLSPLQIINTPPVAHTVTICRGSGSGALIGIPCLLGNVYDADGDLISLVGLSSASAHGGTVSASPGWVSYQPPAGWTNTDSFTYQATDGWSTPVTGTVVVNLTADGQPARNLAIVSLGNGAIGLGGQGVPGGTYVIQYAAGTPSATNWLTLGTVTADASGTFLVVEPGTSGVRFYRAICP